MKTINQCKLHRHITHIRTEWYSRNLAIGTQWCASSALHLRHKTSTHDDNHDMSSSAIRIRTQTDGNEKEMFIPGINATISLHFKTENGKILVEPRMQAVCSFSFRSVYKATAVGWSLALGRRIFITWVHAKHTQRTTCFHQSTTTTK